jgi:hypothetical protein
MVRARCHPFLRARVRVSVLVTRDRIEEALRESFSLR